jgi:hypothetical protein
MSFATFETGVLAFECCFSNLTSAAVYGLRVGLVFFALAKLFSSNRMARHIIYGLVIKRLERFFVLFVRKRSPAGFAMPRAPASIGRDLAAPIDDFLMMTSSKIKAWVAEVKEDASPMS